MTWALYGTMSGMKMEEVHFCLQLFITTLPQPDLHGTVATLPQPDLHGTVTTLPQPDLHGTVTTLP